MCVVAQALHAFCLADVTLCMPANDPASFVRCLGPYLKVPPADPAATEKEKRRGAERLLCILFIISSLLCKLDRVTPEAAQDLEADLVQLITLHIFQSVSDPAGLALHHDDVVCICTHVYFASTRVTQGERACQHHHSLYCTNAALIHRWSLWPVHDDATAQKHTLRVQSCCSGSYTPTPLDRGLSHCSACA